MTHRSGTRRARRLVVNDVVGHLAMVLGTSSDLRREAGLAAPVGGKAYIPLVTLGDVTRTGVLAAIDEFDRLVHHAEVMALTGDSYRTGQRRELLAKDNRTNRD